MSRTADTTSHTYRPLLRLLAELPADQPTIELTLTQLHALLGPPSGADSPLHLPHWNLSLVTATIRQRAGFTAHHNKLARSITVQRVSGISEATR